MYKGLSKEEQRMMDRTYARKQDEADPEATTTTGKGKWRSVAATMLIFVVFALMCTLFFYLMGLRKGSFSRDQINKSSQMYKMMNHYDSLSKNPDEHK